MRLLPPSCPFLAALILAATATTAQAQATRTWVSGVGDDANPCSRTAPCKTFAGAISKTASGGEISVLDPGGFGAVTITKSISITARGVEGGVLSAGTNGVIVNGPGIVVVLRGLTINGVGTGINGVRYLNGSELHIEDCTIEGLAGDGVQVQLSGPGDLYMHDVSITRVAGSGVSLTSATDNGRMFLDDVHVAGGQYGVHVTDGSAALHDCSFVGASVAAVKIEASARQLVASGDVTGCSIERSALGIEAGPGKTTVRLSGNVVTENTVGLSTLGGGVVASYGDNRIAGNGAGVTPTPIQLQ